MDPARLIDMEPCIVRAKRATYVGSGSALLPYRLHSHDLQFQDGDWTYHDSYFGGSDFLGQEIVYFQMAVVWGMNYYGRLLKPDRITAAEIGQMIKKSLTVMYGENRFLGGFEYTDGKLTYVDGNDGNVCAFQGKEMINLDGELVYELAYHGGLITP
jgi:hypothetical protein